MLKKNEIWLWYCDKTNKVLSPICYPAQKSVLLFKFYDDCRMGGQFQILQGTHILQSIYTSWAKKQLIFVNVYQGPGFNKKYSLSTHEEDCHFRCHKSADAPTSLVEVVVKSTQDETDGARQPQWKQTLKCCRMAWTGVEKQKKKQNTEQAGVAFIQICLNLEESGTLKVRWN